MKRYRFSFDADAAAIRRHIQPRRDSRHAARKLEILNHLAKAGLRNASFGELLYAKELKKHRTSVTRKFLSTP
jgi:ribosomal protein L20